MIIPDGFGQVNFLFGGIAAPTGAQCTLGFHVDPASGDAFAAATGFDAMWASRILPQQSSEILFLGCLVKFGPVDTGPSAQVSRSTAGSLTGNGSQPNVAYLVRKSSDLGGRSGRGRMYIPGVNEGDVNSSGALTSTRRTALQTAVEAFMADAATAGNPLYLLHGNSLGIHVPSILTGLSVDATVATQRRRLRR